MWGGQAINRTLLTSDMLSNKISPGALLSPLVGEGDKEIFFGVLTTPRKRMEVPADSPLLRCRWVHVKIDLFGVSLNTTLSVPPFSW